MMALAVTPRISPIWTLRRAVAEVERAKFEPRDAFDNSPIPLGDKGAANRLSMTTQLKESGRFWSIVGPAAATAFVLLLGAVVWYLVLNPIESSRTEIKKLNQKLTNLEVLIRTAAGDIRGARNDTQTTGRRAALLQDQIDRVIRVQIDDLQTKLKNLDAKVTGFHKIKSSDLRFGSTGETGSRYYRAETTSQGDRSI